MTPSPTIFFAGGGTGGHLYPGVSVAQSLKQRLPEARMVFLCTQRPIDKTILEAAGLDFIEQPIVPPVRTVGGLLKFWTKWRETKDLVKKLLKEHQPAAIIGLGGYAAGVAVKTAALKGIPAAMLNQDVIPGKANRYLLAYVQAICCQFEATSRYIGSAHREKIKVTGCPIRQDMINLPSRELTLKSLGLDPGLRTLVVTGASLGAQTVNEAVLESLKRIKLQGWQVLHLTGKDHAAAVNAEYRDLDIPKRVIDFTPGMAEVWAVADLAISRAGASTCAELCACGVPSILMPYPFHKDMHQRANARVLSEADAAVLIKDQKDRTKNAEVLRPVLESLLYDAEKRKAMAAAARALGRPDAADAVAQVVVGMMKN